MDLLKSTYILIVCTLCIVYAVACKYSEILAMERFAVAEEILSCMVFAIR